MKRVLKTLLLLFTVTLLITGCTDTQSTDEDGNKKREFSITETATVNDTDIKINSVEKIEKECSWEFEGVCQSYNEPENDYFLLIDLTIENNGEEDLAISSLLTFDLKNSEGEKGNYAMLTNSINSQLDGSIMPGDLLKGQIAYDVKESEAFNFYYQDSLLDDNIKFIINKDDIK